MIYHAHLPALLNVRGKRIALLGSAPRNSGLPAGCDMIASVNGSHKAFGLSRVDVLFLNGASLGARNKPVKIAVQDALDGLICDTLVFIDPANKGGVPMLGQSRTVYFDNTERRDLLTWATGLDYSDAPGRNTVPSTGITAALVLRKLGAVPVLSGFSLEDGHALSPDAARGHTEQDAKFMSLFEGRHSMTEKLTDEALEKKANDLDSAVENAECMMALLKPQFEAFNARTGHNVYVVRDYVDHMNGAKKHRAEAAAFRELLAHRRATPADDLRAAAQILLKPDANGERREVYSACENRVKVYKFDAVLRALAQKETSHE